MAQTTDLSRILQLQFQVGTTSKGLPKVKNHNFPHVNPAVSDDDLLAAGEAIAALFADTLHQVARVDQTLVTASSSSGSTGTAGSTNSSNGSNTGTNSSTAGA
jgi:hypothetical protein